MSMPLVIGPLDGLGLEGVPCIDVGLVGVISTFHHEKRFFLCKQCCSNFCVMLNKLVFKYTRVVFYELIVYFIHME